MNRIKRIPLLLPALLLVLLVACQAPTSQVTVSEGSHPAPTLTPAIETDVPAAAPSATVDVPAATPSAEPATAETPAGPTAAESGSDSPSPDDQLNTSHALCPEVPRPALALSLSREAYLIADPVSGTECTTTLDGAVSGLFQATGEALYYLVQDDEQFVVKRLGQSGESSLLSFTAAGRGDALGYPRFVVSPDGSRMAWSTTTAGPDAATAPTSTMWVANTDGTDLVNVLPKFEDEVMGGRARHLVPIRFSQDGSTLFYTLSVETGGIWSAFVGRYDSLYALRLNTDAQPTEIFDCPGEYTTTRNCLGDFYEVQGQVDALAYVDGQTLFIVDGMGNVRNAVEFEVDYLGYPTFGANGDLVIYSAKGAASVTPDEGTLYYVAAPLVQPAAAEVLATHTRLFWPRGWLDAEHVVVGYVADGKEGAEWGTAVVGLDGSIQPVASEPAADFVAVLPAPDGRAAPPR